MKKLNKYIFNNISVWSIIFANLIPLLGVFFFDWKIYILIFIYWGELVIVSFYKIIESYKVDIYQKPNQKFTIGGWIISILVLSIFYGVPLIIYLFFIIAIFGPGKFMMTQEHLTPIPFKESFIPLISFFISHGISYKFNYINKEEFKKEDVNKKLGNLFKRFLPMHIAVFFAALLGIYFGQPKYALIIFVLIKTAFDLKAHIKEHRFLYKTSV